MPIKISLSPPESCIPIEAIGNTPQEAWRLASSMADIAAVTHCGGCDSKALKPEVRQVDNDGKPFDSYKIRCTDCGSTLKLGLNREGGGMFKKWDEKWYKPDKKQGDLPI